MVVDRKTSRIRVAASAWLGCSAAAAVAGIVGAILTLGEDAGVGAIARQAGWYWLALQAGPFTAWMGPRAFLAYAEPWHYAAWAGVTAVCVLMILAHLIRPGRRSSIVSTLGVVLWFFLAAVLGMWHI